MPVNPNCNLCDGDGVIAGGERGEVMELCPNCFPDEVACEPAQKPRAQTPFEKIAGGLEEVRALLAKLKSLKPELKKLHKGSIYNLPLIETAHRCGCFYCLQTFTPSEITKWADKGQTALCPKCGIDSVLPSVTDPSILAVMNLYWFSELTSTKIVIRAEERKDGKA
jgi:hypothetical protein